MVHGSSMRCKAQTLARPWQAPRPQCWRRCMAGRWEQKAPEMPESFWREQERCGSGIPSLPGPRETLPVLHGPEHLEVGGGRQTGRDSTASSLLCASGARRPSCQSRALRCGEDPRRGWARARARTRHIYIYIYIYIYIFFFIFI